MAASFVPFTAFGNFCCQRHPSVIHSVSQSVSHSSNQLAGLNVDTFIFAGTCCCCRTAAATNIYSYSWVTNTIFVYLSRLGKGRRANSFCDTFHAENCSAATSCHLPLAEKSTDNNTQFMAFM